MLATAETTAVAGGVAVVAAVSRRRIPPRPGRDTTPPPTSTGMRLRSAGSCATLGAIASAREDAASSATGSKGDVCLDTVSDLTV